MKIFFAATVLASAINATQSWSVDQALISLDLARVAYCGYEHTASHVFTGATEGFDLTTVIYDDTYDIEGFVGVLPSDKAIYVTFRGTASSKNMYIDGLIQKSPYTMWPECEDCEVHTGVQMGYLMVADDVLSEVQRLQALYPDFSVKTTGHSLGADLTHLTAMMLIKNSVEIASMINFGQSRIGNSAFAELSNQVFENQLRVVHNKDVFPHTPFETRPFNYLQSRTEVFEDAQGTYRVCDASGEDPTCSDQYSQTELN